MGVVLPAGVKSFHTLVFSAKWLAPAMKSSLSVGIITHYNRVFTALIIEIKGLTGQILFAKQTLFLNDHSFFYF
jgi:hypothetical protein